MANTVTYLQDYLPMLTLGPTTLFFVKWFIKKRISWTCIVGVQSREKHTCLMPDACPAVKNID